MQSGMVFHALLHGAEGRSGGYDIEQLQLTLPEELDVPALARAWSAVTQRHTALCSSFVWTQGSAPRQRANSDVNVPIEEQDWSALNDAERTERRRVFLTEDRARGFDLQQAPLQRVTVFRLGAGQTELIWTFHHLILDGNSIPVVLREIFEAYEAPGLASSDAEPTPRPFRDYIEWLEARDSSDAVAYFRDLLRDKRAPTPLPGSHSTARPGAEQGYGSFTHALEPAVLEDLRKLAERVEVTLGHIVQAAWAVVLARFTGDRDVVFGGVRACRRSALDGAAERLVGMLMNVVPIRVRISEQQSVRELLTSVRTQNVAVRPFELAPLVEVQRESDLPKGSPLIQTLLLFEREDLNQRLQQEGGDPWLNRTARLHEQPTWPLNVKVCGGDPLTIELLFDRARFRPAVIERLARALAFTLEDIARDENRPLRELTAIPPIERQRLLFEWNETQRPFPRDRLIHELFEQRVDLLPHAVAIELGERTLTYRELEERANRLAHALRARGARPGGYIGICLSRSVELVIAMLAVAKSGAAYLPLDPNYSDERLRFMIAEAKAPLVLTEGRFLERFSVPALALDQALAELASQPVTRPERRAEPSDVAYAIFTSGSTGTPKGVIMSHRAVVNTLDWVSRSFDVGLGDRLLFVTSPSFDLSVYDVFGGLGSGATVVIADDELLTDVEALAAAVFRRKITIWNSAPAALERILPFLPATLGEPCLRLAMLSGDWLPLAMLPALRHAFPKARIVNLGGATEAAIWSNWFAVDAIDPSWTSVPYGRPIQNCRYHVLDGDLRPVPVGAVGELHIGGVCLAEGYFNPQQTAERFLPDPFSSEAGARLYKTGDLARYFDDGDLELLGRLDSQVKIRGFRVELAEVEAALGRLPEVQQAACATHVDGSGHKALAAYLVLRRGAELTEEAVRRALAAQLPEFMVPSRIEFLLELPLSSNGKVDRAALQLTQQQKKGSSFAPAATATERGLVKIWEKVLQRSPIGADDDFFALGGHSLLAVQIFNDINRWRGSKFPLATLFECSTIRSLAGRLDELAATSN
ncbi:MAG TPA: amino acid adenylation domain-containing protein, partial [Polyangiaceae bacterium]|nr:amino acid adenylation domain-containing protein [Polyangiaceae bacterium]